MSYWEKYKSIPRKSRLAFGTSMMVFALAGPYLLELLEELPSLKSVVVKDRPEPVPRQPETSTAWKHVPTRFEQQAGTSERHTHDD